MPGGYNHLVPSRQGSAAQGKEWRAMARLILVVAVSAAACSAAGTVRDPEKVCATFEEESLSGIYDSGTQTGTAVVWEFVNLIEDGDPEDDAVAPYPVRNAPLELWASGGVAFPDARLGLALCKGSDCASKTDPAFWPRRLKQETDKNGILQFSVFVGYGVAGAIVAEFDNCSCRIPVTSAEAP
jgi:hypothetical protein